ncbi:hypothetical protein BDZ91DRAFT_789755 [Kalaharituber pfeilii]|nr:hypothetical protein BDZ91DRAFT_789755 [Kalaharituber pfeilii]
MTPIEYLFLICTVTLAVVIGPGYYAKAAALPEASSDPVEASKMEEIGKSALPFILVLAVGWVIRELAKVWFQDNNGLKMIFEDKKAAKSSEIGLEVFKLKQRGEARSAKREWEAKKIVAEREERREVREWEERKANAKREERTAKREERREIREWEERKAEREERREIREWEERKAERENRVGGSCGMSAAAAGELGGSSGGEKRKPKSSEETAGKGKAPAHRPPWK